MSTTAGAPPQIPNPVAVVHSALPAFPPGAADALAALERARAAPGTAAADSFQVLMAPWGPMLIAVVVFPAAWLDAFRALLPAHDVILIEGTYSRVDVASGDWLDFDAAASVRELLGLQVAASRIFRLTKAPAPAPASASRPLATGDPSR